MNLNREIAELQTKRDSYMRESSKRRAEDKPYRHLQSAVDAVQKAEEYIRKQLRDDEASFGDA
jgi:hypothetical protein